MKNQLAFVLLTSLLPGCRTSEADSPPPSQAPAVVPDAAEPAGATVVGQWTMETAFGGQQIPATMTIEQTQDGLAGVWASMGEEMALSDVELEGNVLRFARTMGPGGPRLFFEGTVGGDRIDGAYDFEGEELVCTGTRAPSG